MRNKKGEILAIMVCAVMVATVLAVAVPVNAGGGTIMFEEDFESYPNGYFPADKFMATWGGWWVTEEGGNKFFRSLPYPGANWDMVTREKFPDNVAIEYMTRHSGGALHCTLRNTYRYGDPPRFGIRISVYSGVIYAYYWYTLDDVYYVSDTEVLGSFTTQPNTWYKVNMVLVEGLAKFYVNDQFISSYDFGAVVPLPLEDFHVHWMTWGQRDLDDIKVETIISATIDIDPDTLTLKSKAKWITAYIELPEGFDMEDIDATTVLLEGNIPAVTDPKYDFVTDTNEYLVDLDGDDYYDARMVKFEGATVRDKLTPGDTVELTVTGKLYDGTPFEGSDTIRVID